MKPCVKKFLLTSSVVFLMTNGLVAGEKGEISDSQFFDLLNLDFPGMKAVKKAVDRRDFSSAKKALCTYYRGRGEGFWWPESYLRPDSDQGKKAVKSCQKMLRHEGDFADEYWTSSGEFNWDKEHNDFFRRMYFFGTMARAYRYSGDEEIAKLWVGLIRAWARQVPGDWNRLKTGIRLRSEWGNAFVSFINSPSFDDESIIVFLKSYYQQARYLRDTHSKSSNWLTFEMAGLYSAAIFLPEFHEAEEWRNHVIQVVLDDLDAGWLPDGVTIEFSFGYGNFFSNYLKISDLGKAVGQPSEPLDQLVQRTSRLYSPYIGIMAPNRKTPAFQDNQSVDVPELLKKGMERFPEREDFQWVVSQGRTGAAPDFLSIAFPYAGFLVIRSGWKSNDNYLCFDAGPVGYRHVHQDKLSVVMWAYGREILYDSGRGSYSDSPYQQYCMDTFAHSTGLVDNRPQRRVWYQNPSPEYMPYEKLDDFYYEIEDNRVWGSGSYTDHYGRAGTLGSDAYPYKKGSTFKSGWGKPASQFRQVAYVAPDVFIVQDFFIPNDKSRHQYEVRWQLDSVNVSVDGGRAETADPGLPNLAVIPLLTDDLEVSATSAQGEPEIMGWKGWDRSRPATALRHVRRGKKKQVFLTLLFPLEQGQTAEALTVEGEDGLVRLTFPDGRQVGIIPGQKPEDRLEITVK